LQNQISGSTFAFKSPPYTIPEFISTAPSHFLIFKSLRMKKLNTYLHKPDVQGAIIISFIFLAIAVVTLVTWGK